ncbi:CLUMA_CG007285, isoform A [Clunio marinus]|uniref:CLUMA_CG007285, isoform A n=1 Tax=Clunio marinus TaxID=568069 RepID=A0A1J1I0F7_9DIPT|nr:CLUMA_CG007285, isoform A [Clunio marinus]
MITAYFIFEKHNPTTTTSWERGRYETSLELLFGNNNNRGIINIEKTNSESEKKLMDVDFCSLEFVEVISHCVRQLDHMTMSRTFSLSSKLSE